MSIDSLKLKTVAALPIIFSSQDVRLIRGGKKTMARKLIRNPPDSGVDVHDAEWVERYANALGFTGCWSFYRELDKSSPYRGKSNACNRIAIDTLRCPYDKDGSLIKVVELRPIPDVDPKYRAGSDGNIYCDSDARVNAKREKPFPVCASLASTGYPFVSLIGEKKKSATVHALVCSAFHGPVPMRNMEVRHLDGNKLNNDPANLKWGTRAENEADKRRHQTLACGSRQGSSKLMEEDVDLIRRTVSIGLVNTNQAAEFYRLNPKTIRGIVAGESWRGMEGAEDEPSPTYEHVYLRTESISVERLQEISEADAKAEGIRSDILPACGDHPDLQCYVSEPDDNHAYKTRREAFAKTWDHINGKRSGCSWADNPWLWAISFRRIEQETR